MTKIMELKFDVLQLSPYSPDLTYSDFLSSNLKKWLNEKRFTLNEAPDHLPNRYLFKRLSEILFQKIEETLGKVYRTTTINLQNKKKPPKINCFSILF